MIKATVRFLPLRGLGLNTRYKIGTKKEFAELFSSKKYRQILGLKDNQNIYKDKDLHRAYLNQIKKFHSDSAQTEQSRKEFEEISKCIISAYEQLKKQDENYNGSAKTEAEVFYDEDVVSQRLFNKSFRDIKYIMYAPGNEQMRNKFIAELEKQKKGKQGSQNNEQKPQAPRTASYSDGGASSSQGGNGILIALGVFGCLLMIPFLGKKSSVTLEPKKQHKVREYTESDYDIMKENAYKVRMKPWEEFYNTILKRRPHMLTYPIGQDPHILKQLAYYSIAQDIHLYEIPSRYLIQPKACEQLLASNSTEHIEKYELTETKPNTLLTLSLEAERALHNIYVSVDDIIKQIQQKGKYTPPKILFKYHGYIMFQIRQKPFSNLQGYRNTQVISLFDLYFEYYSPIFFKRDHFREYLVGFEKQAPLPNSRYFGNVFLNYRKLPKVYLEADKKVVIMRDPKKSYQDNGLLKTAEKFYQENWENYYQRYEKNWKQYCEHQKDGIINYY